MIYILFNFLTFYNFNLHKSHINSETAPIYLTSSFTSCNHLPQSFIVNIHYVYNYNYVNICVYICVYVCMYVYIYILGRGLTTHSSILSWRIPWTEESAVHGITKSQIWLTFTTHTHTHTRIYIYIYIYSFLSISPCLSQEWGYFLM